MTFNKDLVIAGYHILIILSEIDGEVADEERKLIMEYLENSYPVKLNSVEEIVFLDALERGRYEELFEEHAMLFYKHSNLEQRLDLLDFARSLIKADDRIDPEENKYYYRLLAIWRGNGG